MNHRLRSRFVVLGSFFLLVALLLFFVGSRWAGSQAIEAADEEAASTARINHGLLASELQKFRLLPLVLAEFPDVFTVLESGDSLARDRLNNRLELLAGRTDAAVIYLIDASGTTQVASNWRLPTSFVGQNYGFRPYFRDAMRNGSSELFALGTVSGRPGLYLARRVVRAGRSLGTIVVKVEFDRMEAVWARGSGITLVTDSQGVILITSHPAWRFKTTAPLSSNAQADALRTLQFGPRPPERAPVRLAEASATIQTDKGSEPFRVARIAAPTLAGNFLHLSPLAPHLDQSRREALMWALSAFLILGGGGVLLIRQWDRQRLLQESREALKQEVARQTLELREANARLIVESQEREEATLRYVAAREELARANRLGTLGQITAGVAHEINQPIAAIRTFAENAGTLIDKERPEAARDNLLRIVSLTERIATITSELRSFTRRKTPTPVQAELGSILDGALLLMGSNAREQILVKARKQERRRVLIGDRVRLEQVLINLLRNALDAVGKRTSAITVTAAEEDGWMRIRVTDEGPGIDPAIRDSLFSPFETAKPGGLGLGLAIARDIAREFDGDLTLERANDPGATFLLALRIAR